MFLFLQLLLTIGEKNLAKQHIKHIVKQQRSKQKQTQNILLRAKKAFLPSVE
jgi:hypothetical protein